MTAHIHELRLTSHLIATHGADVRGIGLNIYVRKKIQFPSSSPEANAYFKNENG